MKWSDKQIETALDAAVQELIPDMEDELWERGETPAARDSWFLEGTEEKTSGSRGRKILSLAAAAAACFALLFIPRAVLNGRVMSTVYIDVNPSLELRLDRNDRVLEARADNADGRAILGDMDLKGVELNVAVNALIGSMLQQGYITDTSGEVLLSVESRRPEKADALRVRLASEVGAYLDSAVGSGTVYVQNVEGNQELRAMAEEFDISVGRAWLLKKITEAYPELTLEELSDRSIRELCRLLRSMGVDPEDFVEAYTDGSEQAEALEELLDDMDDMDENDDRDDDDMDDDDDDLDDDDMDGDDDDRDDDDDDDDVERRGKITRHSDDDDDNDNDRDDDDRGDDDDD